MQNSLIFLIIQGFIENIRGLFILYSSAVFGSKSAAKSAERQEEAMEKIDEVMQKSSFLGKNQGYLCCTCHILTMILAVVYVVGLITCLVIYFMAAQQLATIMASPPADVGVLKNEVIAWINGNSSDYNLVGTLSFILEGIVDILKNDVNDFISTVNNTLNNLGPSLNVSQCCLSHFQIFCVYDCSPCASFLTFKCI